MSARLYDLQSHPSRRGSMPQMLIPATGADRYQRLAEEASKTLAAVTAAVPDGRGDRALLQRLEDLTLAVKGMCSAELAVREIYRAGHADGMAAVLGTRGRDASRRHLQAVDRSADGGDIA